MKVFHDDGAREYDELAGGPAAEPPRAENRPPRIFNEVSTAPANLSVSARSTTSTGRIPMKLTRIAAQSGL
ncbi:hypothetical protein [Sphaerisporangium sp. NPDC051011]|uniref:hypothetical protein n=1 Tax=Sphaerisporangium sp. NPDC051011 TaxID=3155792 RepID=UPI0033DEB706